MKIISKKIIIAGILTPMLVLSAVSPAIAIPTTDQSEACTKADLLQSNNQTRLETHLTTMKTNFAARLTKMTSNKAEIEQKVTTNRLDAKTKFEERIQNLESIAGLTDTQKQAIETYRINMQQAETSRQTAVDSAREQYRAALMNTVTTQQQTLTQAANTYRITVQAAFETAKINCDDGTAMLTLRNTIKTARQTMVSTRTQTELKAQIKQHATIRNEAIKLANDAFKASAKTYTNALIAVLKPTTE